MGSIPRGRRRSPTITRVRARNQLIVLSVVALAWLVLAVVNFARDRLLVGFVYTGCAVAIGYIVRRLWRASVGQSHGGARRPQ
jgi:hypothetical protein